MPDTVIGDGPSWRNSLRRLAFTSEMTKSGAGVGDNGIGVDVSKVGNRVEGTEVGEGGAVRAGVWLMFEAQADTTRKQPSQLTQRKSFNCIEIILHSTRRNKFYFVNLKFARYEVPSFNLIT